MCVCVGWGGIQYFWEGRHFIRGLDNHLETMLYDFKPFILSQ